MAAKDLLYRIETNLLTIKKELRFILLRMVFSIWETLRKILSSSFSRSREASRADAVPCSSSRLLKAIAKAKLVDIY